MATNVSETKTSRSKPVAPGGSPAPVSPRVEPKKRGFRIGRWLVLTLVLLGIVAGAWYYFMPHNAAAGTTSAGTAASGAKHGGASDAIRVVVAKATLGNIGVYLTGLGNVTPLNTVTVQSRVNGQLMKVLFTEGQMVKEGDLLLQIDSRPYEAQLAQYVAQKEHDQALLDNANIDLQRYQTLWKQDSIPEQTLATQASLVKQDQGTVDSDQALIDQTKLNITYCNITAPISGRVGLRLVDEGNYVQSTSTSGLLVITQIQPITVIFTIPEDNVPEVEAKITAGQTLTVDAYDRSMKQKLAEGSLLTTDNQIDQSTGTLKLKAVFPNTHNELFPNQFVNTRLLVEMKKDVTLVPLAAIQHGTQGTFVYVVNRPAAASGDVPAATDPAPTPDPNAAPDAKAAHATRTVKLQNVEVGTVEGDQAEINSGLSPGDTVVIDGVDKLQNGSKVMVQDSGAGGKTGAKKTDATAAAGSS